MPPSPAPVAPCVMVMNEALVTAPHVQLEDVRIEMDAEPPEAENDVVVFPVMTSHVPGGNVEPGPVGLSSLQAIAATSTAAERVSSIRRE